MMNVPPEIGTIVGQSRQSRKSRAAKGLDAHSANNASVRKIDRAMVVPPVGRKYIAVDRSWP
jgi:hypothetical protein